MRIKDEFTEWMHSFLRSDINISIIKGDITKLDVDCIVNAANSSLLGGGGVDGAIHRASGPQLLEECKKLNGCKTGEAVITKGYNLKAKYVIHTVGPVFGKDDINLLKNCYQNSLKIAEENNCESIAFPAISTGAYRVPIEKSAEIVKEIINKFTPNSIKKIIFVLYSDYDLDIYKNILRSHEK